MNKEQIIDLIKKIFMAIVISALISLVIVIFARCSTVQYKEYTGIKKCDMSIMLVKVKSKKGYAAFEVGEYIKACFKEIDRQVCKKAHFPKKKISYDKKDPNYIDYLSCLESRK